MAKQGEVGRVHGNGPKRSLRSGLPLLKLRYARIMVVFLP